MANNRPVHFEIPAHRPQELLPFYESIFGWEFTKADIPGMDYWFCKTGSEGPGIDGAIMPRMNAHQPFMNYIDVESIDATLEKVVAAGGQVALPKMPIADMGFVAAFLDPQGTLLGLWELTRR